MSLGTKNHPEKFTDLQNERLILFRKKCEDLGDLLEEQKEDAQLIRWLRARNLDIEKAHKMLQLSLKWRKENKIDGILERETFLQGYNEVAPFGILGGDKNGYPIILSPIGRQDLRALLEKHGVDEVFKCHLMGMEIIMKELKKFSEEQGRPVAKFVQIVDFEGYSIRQLTNKLCRDFMIRVNKTMEPNYPEIMDYALIINAPKVFSLLFNLVKQFIPKETLVKIDIYGPEPEKWKKAIAEKFPLEFVPPHWGGTRQGSDEFCSQDDIWYHGPVPLLFFTGGSNNPGDENLTKVIIDARGAHRIMLEICKPNSSIVWRFRSDNHDIGFKVTRLKGDKENVILPFSRVQSQNKLQEEFQICNELGTYVFVFDNTYSIYRSKSVYYNVSVMEPVPSGKI